VRHETGGDQDADAQRALQHGMPGGGDRFFFGLRLRIGFGHED
jgi:hypothetical protein